MENDEKTDIIRSSISGPLKELLTDITDLSLNQVIEIITKKSELLKDIPLIRWLLLAMIFAMFFKPHFFFKNMPIL